MSINKLGALSPVAERPIPHFSCQCGWQLTCDHWPKPDATCQAAYDAHMELPWGEHFVMPEPNPHLECECSRPGCEHTGCDASDHVAEANEGDPCPECGWTQRVVCKEQTAAA